MAHTNRAVRFAIAAAVYAPLVVAAAPDSAFPSREPEPVIQPASPASTDVVARGFTPFPCPWDLNMDCLVNAVDLGQLLGSWGPCIACAADFDGDGRVGSADLGQLLGAWGACPHQVGEVSFLPINNTIDANPNAGAGERVFVDDQSPGDLTVRNTVIVDALVNPPLQGITIYFRPFDVDDPSVNNATSLVDQNDAGGTPKGDDNRGRFAGMNTFTPDTPRLTSQGGHDGRLGNMDLSTLAAEGAILSAVTDTGGHAQVRLVLTFSPGDNYRVAASCNQAELMALQADDGSGGGAEVPSGNTETLEGFTGRVSPMLTVWRTLNVEFDSMGQSANAAPSEDLFGVVIDTTAPAMGSTALTATVLTDGDETWGPNGQLIGAEIDPDSADATAEAYETIANNATTATIEGRAIGIISLLNVTVADGETFTISDGGTDGINTTVTFEFDLAPGNGVAGGNTAVVVPAMGQTPANLRPPMIAAINGAAGLGVLSGASGANNLILLNTNPGTGGNVAIAETVADADFTVNGMANGQALTTNAAVGNPYRINTDDVAPGAPPNPPLIARVATLALLNAADMYRKAYIRAVEVAAGIDTTDDSLGWDRNFDIDEVFASSSGSKDGPTGSARFWCVMVQGVYDPSLDSDADPGAVEGALFGIISLDDMNLANGHGVAVVYQESSRDANPGNADLPATAAHEITHCFGCQHASGNLGAGSTDVGDPMGSPANPETDDDIMTTDFPVPGAKQILNEKHQNEIRTRLSPAATPFTANPT